MTRNDSRPAIDASYQYIGDAQYGRGKGETGDGMEPEDPDEKRTENGQTPERSDRPGVDGQSTVDAAPADRTDLVETATELAAHRAVRSLLRARFRSEERTGDVSFEELVALTHAEETASLDTAESSTTASADD